MESKKAALESARINLNWTTVTAPIAGRIGISSVTPGALVSADQDTALATIRGLDTMYVDLTRSSVDLLRLRKQSPGQQQRHPQRDVNPRKMAAPIPKKGVWRSPKSPSMNLPAR